MRRATCGGAGASDGEGGSNHLGVAAGTRYGVVAYGIFLRGYPSGRIPEFDRRVAPALALCVGAIAAVGLAASWLAYLWGGETHFTFGP